MPQNSALSSAADVEKTNRPQGQAEKPASDLTMDDLSRKAERVSLDPALRAAADIRATRGDKAPEDQTENLTALNAALVSLLVKLAKKGVDINRTWTTTDLKREVAKNGLSLSLNEAAAVENLDRILNEHGPTANEIKSSWQDRVKAAQEAGKGWTDRYADHYKKDPVATIALTVAGAAAIYLGFQGIKGIAGKAFADKADKKDGGSSWFKKEIMIPMVIMAAGAFLGKDAVKRMLADAGLDYFDVEKRLKEGKELTAQQQSKIRGAGPKVAAAVDQMKKKSDKASQDPHSVASEDGRDESPEETAESPQQSAGEAEESTLSEQAEVMAAHQIPMELLIGRFCYDTFDYSEQDRAQIRDAMRQLSGKKISQVLALYKEYEGKKTIPAKNTLLEFKNELDEKNIYMAVMILAKSAEDYKKLNPKIDYAAVTLTEFLDQHINRDAVSKVHNAVQESLVSAVDINGITDLKKLGDIDLKQVEGRLEEVAKDGWEHLAANLGVNLEGVNKAHFSLMLAFLQRNALMTMDADAAFGSADFPKSDEKTMAAARLFYEKIRERTVNVVIPAAVTRFNLDAGMVNNAENADIIKKHLTNKILFKRGLYLCLVTQGFDLSKPITPATTTVPQEMTFLFTVLSSIPEEQKRHYVSELGVLGLKYPEKLPSLALVQPYLKEMASFGVKMVGHKLKAASSWASALMPNRSPAEQQKFLEEMRDAPLIRFGAGMAMEATGGALEVGKEIINPLLASGKVTIEEIGQCESAEDFMLLVKKAGGTFIYSEDENGNPQGAIHVAGDIFFFRPIGIIKETFSTALLERNPTGALKVWAAGSAPFVTYGAVHGWYMSYLKTHRTGSQVLGAAKGGLKMLLGYPYYALKPTYRAARSAAIAGMELPRAAQRLNRGVVDLVKYRSVMPGQNVANMMENGRRFKHYLEHSDFEHMSLKEGWHKFKHEKSGLAKKLFMSSFNNEMTLRYAERFADNYNHFFGFEEGASYKLNVAEILKGNKEAFDRAVNRFTRLYDIFENIGKYDSIFDEMKATMRGGLTGDDLQRSLIKSLQKMKGIEPDEARALAKQLLSEGDITKLQGRMKDGFRFLDGVRPPNAAEAARGFGKAEAAIAKAESDLVTTAKRIKTAEDEIRSINALRGRADWMKDSKALQARLDAARKVIEDANVSQVTLNKSLADLRWVQEIEGKLATVTDAAAKARLERQLRIATQMAEESTTEANGLVKGASKLGKVGSTLKWGFRGLGIAGVAFQSYEALSSAHEAITTDVEGRGTVKGVEAGFYAAGAAADAAVVAVMFGKGGVVAAGASKAALPLVPITYAATTMLATKYEETKKDYEWIQGNPYQVLSHFYTSVNSVSLGDAWITGMHIDTVDESLNQKTATMHKIYRGLVSIQKDPELLNYIASEPPSDKKNKEVEKRIAANYTPYHEFYFRSALATSVQNYHDAQRFILDAQVFDDIMHQRDQAKAKNEPFVIVGNDKLHPYSLHLDRYSITTDKGVPKAGVDYSPQHVVQAYKESLMSHFESDAVLKANLERMDSAYLIRLYAQTRLTLSDPSLKDSVEKEVGLKEALIKNVKALEAYLVAGRGIDLALASRQPEYHKPRMSLVDLEQHLGSMGQIENQAFVDFEKDKYQLTSASHALYKLAEYFGYTGEPSEIRLKEFFSEASASYHGVYWDGKQWRLQKRGMDLDYELGSELNEFAVRFMIGGMKADPDNILEHRSDKLFMDAYDFTDEVKHMANILENGLKEGKAREYGKNNTTSRQRVPLTS